MNKMLFPLAGLLAFFALFSCNKSSDRPPARTGACPLDQSRLKAVYELSDASRALHTFSYDNAGRLKHVSSNQTGLELTLEYPASGSEVMASQDGFTFNEPSHCVLDSAGRIVRRYVERNSVSYSYETFEYNAAGKLVRSLRATNAGGIATTGDSTLFTWQDGDLMRIASYYGGELSQYEDYTYDLSQSGDHFYVHGWNQSGQYPTGWYIGQLRYAPATSAHLYKEMRRYTRQGSSLLQVAERQLRNPVYDAYNRLERYEVYYKLGSSDSGSEAILLSYGCK